MSIKIKAAGSWTTATPSVKVGGTWRKVKRAYSKVGGSWETTFEFEHVYTLNTGIQEGTIDIDALAIDRTNDIKIIVPSGATLVAPSTSTYAIKTGTSHVGKITLVNNGNIYGRGGNGGGGGYRLNGSNSPSPSAGGDGGDAIHIESNITIDNNGTIDGGGGGGGGGEGSYVYRHAGGSGGGGGAPYGTGGAGRSANGSGSVNAGNGATAGLTTGGAGGSGSSAPHGSDKTFYGGIGGAGGDLSEDGLSGGYRSGPPSVSTQGTGIASGGVDGNSYYNPNNYTITQI